MMLARGIQVATIGARAINWNRGCIAVAGKVELECWSVDRIGGVTAYPTTRGRGSDGVNKGFERDRIAHSGQGTTARRGNERARLRTREEQSGGRHPRCISAYGRKCELDGERRTPMREKRAQAGRSSR